MPRPSSATDSRKPIERTDAARTVICRAFACLTALVSASCATADDLALDGVAVARQVVDLELDGYFGRPPRHVRHALERDAEILSFADDRPERGDGPPGLDHVAAREVDRGLQLRRDRRRHVLRFTLRRLQLHQDGGEALRERVVDVAREAVALLEDRLAALFEAAAIRLLALMQGERRLSRDGFEQRDAPLALAHRRLAVRERHPSERPCGEHQRRDRDRMNIRLAVERTNRLRQTRIVAGILDRLAPAGGV